MHTHTHTNTHNYIHTHTHTNTHTHTYTRIAIGPAVAGIIGSKKFSYDIWGDCVNTASRMESHGIPGRIQVTDEIQSLMKDKFIFEERGIVEIKGKGPMKVWFLNGKLLNKNQFKI